MQRHVDRHALRRRAARIVGRGQIAEDAPPAIDRLDVAMFQPEAERPVKILFHPRQVRPVLIDEALRLLSRQTGIAGEPVRLHAVDDPEVDGLGDAAHVRGHFFPGDSMDDGRGHRVDVLAPRECIDQERLAAHVRQQPQLDL